MTNRIKLLLLDFDGTLADTRRANTLAYVEALREAGHTLTEEEYAAEYFGMRCNEFLTRFGIADPHERERIRLRKIALYPAFFDTVRLNRPLWDFAQAFRAQGGRVWIVSTGSRANLENAMRHLGIGIAGTETDGPSAAGSVRDTTGKRDGENIDAAPICVLREDGPALSALPKDQEAPVSSEAKVSSGIRDTWGTPVASTDPLVPGTWPDAAEGLLTGAADSLTLNPADRVHTGAMDGLSMITADRPNTGAAEGLFTGTLNGMSMNAADGLHTVAAERPHGGDVDGLLAGPDVARSKPAPDCFLRAMEIEGVTPRETLIFEDSEIGLEAARRSGASYIRVRL